MVTIGERRLTSYYGAGESPSRLVVPNEEEEGDKVQELMKDRER